MKIRQTRADAHERASLGSPHKAGNAGAETDNEDQVPEYFTLYLLREILSSIGFRSK